MRGIVVILEDYNERICSKIFFSIIKQRMYHPGLRYDKPCQHIASPPDDIA